MTRDQFTEKLYADAYRDGNVERIQQLECSKDDAWVDELYAAYQEGK